MNPEIRDEVAGQMGQPPAGGIPPELQQAYDQYVQQAQQQGQQPVPIEEFMKMVQEIIANGGQPPAGGQPPQGGQPPMPPQGGVPPQGMPPV